MEGVLSFLMLLSFALYYIFKPWEKKLPFYVNDEESPENIVDYYTGLLRLHGVILTPDTITDAYYVQRFKIVHNREPGDASLDELEAAREYLTNRCAFLGSLN